MDDYILILRAKTKDELVKLANIINEEFNECITNDNITLNLDKTELLYLNRGHTRNLPTENSYSVESSEFNGKKLEAK